MDSKQIVFLSLLLFPILSFSMTLKGNNRVFDLNQNKAGQWITRECKNCDASKTLTTLTKEQVKTLLAKEPDGRVSPGARLCSALGALTWVLEDEKSAEWSVCEFKDKSAVLTDDLGGLVRKLNQ